MKKHLSILAIALVCIAGCKKEEKDTTPKTFTHVGIWNGKYGNGKNAPNSNYGMVLFSGKIVNAYDGMAGSGSLAAGEYTAFAGDSIKGFYKYTSGNQFYFRAKFNTERTRMDGRWGADTLAMTGGTFFLNK